MAACDVLVNLRSPTMGETSGAVIRGLALGKPMLVSDVGWFSELPDEAVLKIPVDEYEVQTIAAALELAADACGRARVGGARVRRGASTTSAARQTLYAAALEEAAGGEAVTERRPDSDRRGRGRDRHRRPDGDRPGRARGRSGVTAVADREQATDAPADRRDGTGLDLSRGSSWGWLTGIVVVSIVVRIAARPPDGRALDHDRRDRLLGAREERRGARAVPRPRRAVARLRLRLPGADRARVAALHARSPTAYAAAKAINAVLMSLAAIPAYFLARRLLPARLSLVVAALTVTVPSMLYTGELMTENAFYPIFLLRRAAARRHARAADGGTADRPPRRSARSRSRRARRRSRSSPRSRPRRCCSRLSSGAAGAGPCGRYALLYGLLDRRRRSSRSPPPSPAAARR